MTTESTPQRLARTINMGLDLGAPLERGWTIEVSHEQLDACARHGFTAVRVLTCLAEHRAPAGLDPLLLRRVETVLDDASELGLAVILANHLDPALMDDPGPHLAATLASVGHLAAALAGRGPDVVVEPLAEPRGALDEIWNKTAGELIATVRTHDADRPIMIGPRTLNNARFLPELELPAAEQNLVVAVHHYWPITFTMQGETWLGTTPFGHPTDWLGTIWDGTPTQQAELRTGFDALAAWSQATGRPVCVAEFGSTVHADPASRVRWTRFNRHLAEERGMFWGIWSFAPTFAVYDQEAGRFDPDLLAALMDSEGSTSRASED